MYRVHVIMPVGNWAYGIIDDVIKKSKYWSTFGTAVASLIVNIQARASIKNSKRQGILMAI